MPSLFNTPKEKGICSRYYVLMQEKWAKKMSALTSRVSQRGLFFLLIFFVSSTGAACVYSIYKGFQMENSNIIRPEVRAKSTTVQKTFSKSDDEKSKPFRDSVDGLQQGKEAESMMDVLHDDGARLHYRGNSIE